MVSRQRPTKYNPKKSEPAWQKKWLTSDLYRARDFDSKKKYYVLVEFPYPSGEGLHVGHCLSYIAQDIVARFKRMQGYNVLYPMGWDAFGLPTENFAIKNKIKPQQATKKNIANFKRQIQSLGISFDWSREINTTDPSYYRWTQWIFLQLFKKGLAEKKEVPINWCPKDKIGLAFEEVIDGKCERCGTQTVQRTIKQWVLKITKYADRLIDDLDTVDFLPEIKQQQINWIGRSEGAEIEFVIQNTESRIQNLESGVKVFTTRPDTLFGATYLVLAPEHPMVQKLETRIQNLEEVKKYISAANKKTDRQRQENKEKTGVELHGVKAVNPANNEEIPVWVADYVLFSYGTGAIMAVPAHDERDFEFAKKFNLKIIEVIQPEVPVSSSKCWTGEGMLVNSGKFNGTRSEEARDAITKFVGGTKTVNYKLRDWIFSRQHYWGEPIPIVVCETCGYVPLDEKDLPLKLPDVKHYEPTDTGESPLASIKSWVNVTCPNCKQPAKRETDTMPNWAGSSWYFLRYTDPNNDTIFADPKKLKYWLPVDLYNGGAEHTTLHLLYSRFWHKFLYDLKEVPTPEPYQRRVQHGMILGPDGVKMSKSRGNVINPDEIVDTYGADTFRLYMMFMGEYDKVKIWSEANLQGVARFMKRLRDYFGRVRITDTETPEELSLFHQTLKKVQSDIERRSFNTVVSHMMVFLNTVQDTGTIGKSVAENFIRMLAPYAPHTAEEVWHSVAGHTTSVHAEQWPVINESYITEAGTRVAIQVNGKVRAAIVISAGMSEETLQEKVLALPQVQKYVSAKPKKFIYVKNKIISIVV